MNKTTEALKVAEKAANRAITTLEYFKTIGIHSDSIDPTIRAEKKALAAIREVLAQPVKQEPVVNLFDVKKKAFEQLRLEVKAPEDKWTVGDSINFFGFYSHGFEAGIKYAAPVDAKAIRADALEEAAQWFEGNEDDVGYAIATEIRGLK